MIKILICIWLFIGLIACWRDYHGYLKWFYEQTGYSYWDKAEVRNKISIVQFIFYCIMVCFGPIALYSMEQDNMTHDGCWWFNTRNLKK